MSVAADNSIVFELQTVLYYHISIGTFERVVCAGTVDNIDTSSGLEGAFYIF